MLRFLCVSVIFFFILEFQFLISCLQLRTSLSVCSLLHAFAHLDMRQHIQDGHQSCLLKTQSMCQCKTHHKVHQLSDVEFLILETRRLFVFDVLCLGIRQVLIVDILSCETRRFLDVQFLYCVTCQLVIVALLNSGSWRRLIVDCLFFSLSQPPSCLSLLCIVVARSLLVYLSASLSHFSSFPRVCVPSVICFPWVILQLFAIVLRDFNLLALASSELFWLNLASSTNY